VISRRTAVPKVRTHYDNLKVARDAPPEVIRAAYKSLSQKYHPDRNPGDPKASRTMAIINAAYRVLSDPDLRRKHDEWIRKVEAEPPAKPRPTPRPAPDRPSRRPTPKAPAPQAPPFKSKYKIVNHLRHYGWVYLFLALVEFLLIATMLFL
jgi:curved DNA-binding protein CbpA